MVTPPKHRIALVVCYFGPWPKYMKFFLWSCRRNPEIDYLIFGDSPHPGIDCPNVFYHHLTITQFTKLASTKLQLHVDIHNPYKICDFKPAFGVLFGQYLQPYSFWGHTDLDLVFGSITNFISDDLLNSNDIISGKNAYISGHFTLFRNSEKINWLFKSSPDYKKVLEDGNRNYCFDECSALWFELLDGKSIFELPSDTISMTHLVKYFQAQGSLRAHFGCFVCEQDQLTPDGNLAEFQDVLLLTGSQLHSKITGKEYMYFHFHFLKKTDHFCVPDWNLQPAQFEISKNGFSSVGEIRLQERL